MLRGITRLHYEVQVKKLDLPLPTCLQKKPLSPPSPYEKRHQTNHNHKDHS
jgi:hypothetical protein